MGTRTTPWALLLLPLLACSGGPLLPRTARGEVVLEVGGEVKHGPFRLGAADLDALRQATIRGANPATGREAEYRGADLGLLEDRVELTKGADTLVVRSADGRAMPVPLSVLRQLHPVLARGEDGSYALAWPNVEHFGLRTDPRARLWWVDRVVRMDFVPWAQAYGRALRVPIGAPVEALAGARTYGARCIGCHGLRGAGGKVGPDLSKGGPFTDVAKLRSVLADHPGWTGPGLPTPPETSLPELATFLRIVPLAGDDIDEAPKEDDVGPPASAP